MRRANMRLMWGIVLLLVVTAGCGNDGSSNGDDSPADGGASSDSSIPNNDAPSANALSVTWEATPSIPGSAPSGLVIDKAVFRIDRLQVIGDNGEPANTTARDLTLTWDTSTGGNDPADVVFNSAPPALYSKVRLLLDRDVDDNPSIELRGQFTRDLDTSNFRIVSRRAATVEVPGYTVSLLPGATAEMNVEIDLSELLDQIDYEQYVYDADNDEYSLDDSQTSEMTAFLGDLDKAFDRPSGN